MTLLFGEDTILAKMKQDKMDYTPFVSMSQKWSAADPQKAYQSPVAHYPSDGEHRGKHKISRRERNDLQENAPRSHHAGGGNTSPGSIGTPTKGPYGGSGGQNGNSYY